ncbi:MAG: MFS transporter [Clostridiales bacterium]|jgi:oligogalacturonide transporter|nr:MFS transporter [Clostridiales bacterium]
MKSTGLNAADRAIGGAEIKPFERFCYALGDFFGGGAGGMITAVYVVYLAINGLNPGLAASIVMVAKIWDAISDPLMGVISDNARTKWGRRRPFIFAGGLLITFSLALLFIPLYTVQFTPFKYVVYLLAYLVFSTVSTVIGVPYSSLLTEMTADPAERNKMNTVRMVVSMLSGAISAGVPIILVEILQKGGMKVGAFSLMMIFGFGLLYGVPLVMTAVFTKERLPVPEEKNKFSIKEFVRPLKLKAFLLLVIMYFTAFTCMDLITANIIYMATYGLNVQKFSSFIILVVIMVAYAATIPLHNKLMKTRSKAFLFRVGIPLYIVGIVSLCLYPKGFSDYLILPIAVLIGLGMSGCQLMPWYIFPDVVDLGELKFNKRNAGAFSGVMTFIRKSTSAVAIGLSGWVLELVKFKPPETDQLTGYVTRFDQTEGAVWGLRLVIMIPVIVMTAAAFIAATKLKISPERSTLVGRFLASRDKEGFSAAELDEIERIKKDCF